LDGYFFILAAIVLFAYTTQTISGFGSIIIALTLGANFYPIPKLLPILVLLTVIMNIYLLTKHRSYIDRTLLIKRILPLMVVGFAIGVFVFNYFQTGVLKNVYGIFVVIFSLREIIILVWKKNEQRPLTTLQTIGWMFSAGVVHGIYASGGPLIVYPVSRIITNKSVFRSTLIAVWLFFNIILIVTYAATCRFTIQSLTWTAMLLPIIALSVFLGEWLHNYVNEYKFRILVYIILTIAGLFIATQ
jgi:uncharacterized membrane protein YfcA